MLVSLTENKREIKRQNKYLRNQKRKYGKTDPYYAKIKELESMDDFCLSYDKYLDSFSIEEKIKYFKVPDTENDFKGIYIVDLNSDGYLSRLVTPHMIDSLDMERKLYFHGYGVCDNASQVLEEYERLIKDGVSNEKQHIITMTPIFKKDKSGWRWKKWGKYIGVQNRSQEYLADEKDIEMIFVYSIKEVE